MDNIDLTLRKEFLKKSTRLTRYDDTNRYIDKLGYEDQRRAKIDILASDNFKINMFGIKLSFPSHHDFFEEDKKYGWREYELHETILKITGVLTKTLKIEHDSGYGDENACDCCGGFRSHILNSEKYGICDTCEKGYRFKNSEFWERKRDFILETWVD